MYILKYWFKLSESVETKIHSMTTKANIHCVLERSIYVINVQSYTSYYTRVRKWNENWYYKIKITIHGSGDNKLKF